MKFKLFIFLLLIISSTASAVQGSVSMQESRSCCFSHPIFEVKMSYFIFSHSKMRKIYDKGGLDFQLCASYPIWRLNNKWTLNAYGAVEYFHRSGKSINGHQKTALWSVPVNLGLKPVYTLNANMQYYFALGPRYFYIHQHNHSSDVHKNRSRSGLGYFVNTGINYLVCDCLGVDIFGEYSYAKVHFHRGNSRVYSRNIQVGGYTLGGGIGYTF